MSTQLKCKVAIASHLSNSKPSSFSPKTLAQRPSSSFLVLFLSQLLSGVPFSLCLCTSLYTLLMPKSKRFILIFFYISKHMEIPQLGQNNSSCPWFPDQCPPWLHPLSFPFLSSSQDVLSTHPKGRHPLRFSPLALLSIHSRNISFAKSCSSCWEYNNEQEITVKVYALLEGGRQ